MTATEMLEREGILELARTGTLSDETAAKLEAEGYCVNEPDEAAEYAELVAETERLRRL
jgi:hypothetical protein